MTLQRTDGKVFDGIVYAEVAPRKWLTGSERHARTNPFGGPEEHDAERKPVRLIMVYKEDGTTVAYRNGVAYGEPIRGERVRYGKGKAQVVFGVRHGLGPGADGRALTGRILEARLYDRALTAAEVAAASSGTLLEIVTGEALEKALNPSQRRDLQQADEAIAGLETQLAKVESEIAARQEAAQAGGDPYFKIAHALLNSKELIYVY